MRSSYQLTPYPIGSLREIAVVSWPLILGVLSSSLMMFADRLFLANYSREALNASTTGGMAAYMLTIFPLVIASMSEVFVGRLNGGEAKKEIGRSVWQMIWFSLATGPLFWLLSRLLTPILFYSSPLLAWERDYFVVNSDFAPFWCMSCALMGFYIGTGRSRVVMIVTIVGNALNILLDYFLVFGVGPFPEMGVRGAALATGIASLFQAAVLLIGFLSEQNHVAYRTRNFAFIGQLFKEGIWIGLPAGTGRFVEVCAHMVFLKAVAFSGDENLTIVAIVQSIYLLIVFCCEGLSKAVTAIISNLIGARQWHLIGAVLKAASFQHLLLFCFVTYGLFHFSTEVIEIFISEKDAHLLHNVHFRSVTLFAMGWMCLCFLFDGLAWVVMGQLLAAQDTKFLLYASLLFNWLGYVLPTLIGIFYFSWGAREAWIILGISSFSNFAILLGRYLSGRWKENVEQAAF